MPNPISVHPSRTEAVTPPSDALNSLSQDLPLADLLNRLMDVSQAGEIRLNRAAGQVRSPALRAAMLLRASQHAQERDALLAWVVRLRGTPHAGETSAWLADPAWQALPNDGSDEALRAACLGEQKAHLECFEQALADGRLPDEIRSTLQACATSAREWIRRESPTA